MNTIVTSSIRRAPRHRLAQRLPHLECAEADFPRRAAALTQQSTGGPGRGTGSTGAGRRERVAEFGIAGQAAPRAPDQRDQAGASIGAAQPVRRATQGWRRMLSRCRWIRRRHRLLGLAGHRLGPEFHKAQRRCCSERPATTVAVVSDTIDDEPPDHGAATAGSTLDNDAADAPVNRRQRCVVNTIVISSSPIGTRRP